MEQKKPMIYGFNNGGSPGWMHAMALAEDGTHLADHLCSDEWYMPHDLGMDGRSDWKHEQYRAHYPDGWESEFVPYDKVADHPGLQASLQRFKDRGAEAALPEKDRAGVTIEFVDDDGKTHQAKAGPS